MNKSDLRNLIKSTIEEILKERTINVADKKDIPKDLKDDDIVNIDKKLKNQIAQNLSKTLSLTKDKQNDNIKNMSKKDLINLVTICQGKKFNTTTKTTTDQISH